MKCSKFISELAACLGGHPLPKRLGLAVSGGSDSMALLHLAADWGRAQGVELHAFTVNHGLRAEAAEEAKFVARHAKLLGLPHQTLTVAWPDGPPKSNIQSQARNARYEVMARAAQAQGIDHLLTAHTEDDQAETFLLRLARGSGLDGLSAMASRTSLFGLVILRPLLSSGRADLRTMLEENSLNWIEDPSNMDPKYARVRMRSLLPGLAAEGLTMKRLARTAAELRTARDALNDMAGHLLGEHGEIAPEGYVSLKLSALQSAPRDIGMRVLMRMLRTVNPLPYRPRAERLDALYTRLMAAGETGQNAFRRTLGGCIIKVEAEQVLVYREMRVLPAPMAVTCGQKLVWQNLYDLVVSEGIVEPCEVRALGRPGFDQLKREARGAGFVPPKDPWYAHLPSLWTQDKLLSAPFWPQEMVKTMDQSSLLEARFRPVRLGFST